MEGREMKRPEGRRKEKGGGKDNKLRHIMHRKRMKGKGRRRAVTAGKD